MSSAWYPSPAELPAYVSGLIAEVDGFTPAPYGISGRIGTNPALYLTPDRRASSAVLVGLSVSTVGASPRRDAWLSLMSLTVGGVELVEGAVPMAALLGGDNATALQAPVVQDPSTPLVLRAIPMEPSFLATPVIDVSAVYLSCSARAARRVEQLLGGRARWWGVGAADGGPEGYLNVERGGRALAYSAATALADNAQPSAAAGNVVTLERDGRTMMASYGVLPLGDWAVEGYPHALRTFAHDVEAGSVYRARFDNSGTPPSARFLAWFSGVETPALRSVAGSECRC